jgi:hypothetical protein
MVKLNKTDKLVINTLKSGELTLQQIADQTGEKPKKIFKSLRKLFENELITTNARKYKLTANTKQQKASSGIWSRDLLLTRQPLHQTELPRHTAQYQHTQQIKTFTTKKPHTKPHTKTLIPHDTTIILAKPASKTTQQHKNTIKKEMQLRTHTDAGVKRWTEHKAQNDTTHRQKQRRTNKKNSPNAKQTPPYGPTTPTPSGEWLGLRADEGRGKPRYRPG